MGFFLREVYPFIMLKFFYLDVEANTILYLELENKNALCGEIVMQLTCSFQILTRGIWSCWFCGQDWEAAMHRTVQLSTSSSSPLSRHCNSIKIHLVKFLITQALSFLSSSPNLLMLSMFDSLYFAPVQNSPAPSTGWFAFVVCLGNRKAALTPSEKPSGR